MSELSATLAKLDQLANGDPELIAEFFRRHEVRGFREVRKFDEGYFGYLDLARMAPA